MYLSVGTVPKALPTLVKKLLSHSFDPLPAPLADGRGAPDGEVRPVATPLFRRVVDTLVVVRTL